MGKHLKSILVILGIFILVIFIVDKVLLSPTTSQTLSYSTFYNDVESGKIKSVTISGRDISGEFSGEGGQKFTTTVPDDRDLYPTLRKHVADIKVLNNQSTPLIGYVFNFVPFIIMALLLIFILRQAQ
ncbi:MAG: ATP-dependent metallopeptidase FtsH/Yme1/Tma family protein, partial [Candidatus Eremiobacteraeota bacterium]|nr:ATP-dependent metallopeptidase FtsH/Yme1/Tma family protein [Candidatus Eremiobacteraeota bacterium]